MFLLRRKGLFWVMMEEDDVSDGVPFVFQLFNNFSVLILLHRHSCFDSVSSLLGKKYIIIIKINGTEKTRR